MDKKLEISKEKKDEMNSLIQNYFSNEREMDIGELAASLILDFFIEELAPDFYNKGVYDAYVFMNEKVEDLLGVQIYKR